MAEADFPLASQDILTETNEGNLDHEIGHPKAWETSYYIQRLYTKESCQFSLGAKQVIPATYHLRDDKNLYVSRDSESELEVYTSEVTGCWPRVNKGDAC